MRRLVLFLCLVSAPLGACFSQVESDDLNVYADMHLHAAVTYYSLGIDLNFEEAVFDWLYLEEYTGIYYAPGSYYGCGVNFTVGVKFKPVRYVYGIVDFQPNTHVHGVGHQAYGDYLLLYLRCGLGIGGVLPIGSDGEVYIEAKVCSDLVLLDDVDSYDGGTWLLVGFGYRYKFF